MVCATFVLAIIRMHISVCVCMFKAKSFLKEFLGRQTIVLTGSISLCSTNLVLIKRTVVDDGHYWCGVVLEILG